MELSTSCVDATTTTTPAASTLVEQKTPGSCNGPASLPKARRPLADVSNESPLSRACFNSELFLNPKATVLPPCQLNTFNLPSTPATAEPKSQPPEDAPAGDDSDFEVDDDVDDDEEEEEEDAASTWSVSVNVSTPIDRADDTDEEGEEGESEEEHSPLPEEVDDEEEQGDEEEELCRGIGSISLAVASSYAGKHIRFSYDSDDEDRVEDSKPAPPTPRLKLNGLPTPTGKHSRFDDPR